jgi:spore coat polysaccharide biosynthesis protein SpsF
VAVVQARMGASRLPNKMLLHLNGYPIVQWIFQRLSNCKLIDDIVFAIPDGPGDDVLELSLNKMGAIIFRGSEQDVLGRFYTAAKCSQGSHIVRVCADNPLICPVEVDRLVSYYFANVPCDYLYNHIPKNNLYPDGLGAEIVSFSLLEDIHNRALKPEQREHVFNYIWDNKPEFLISTFDPSDPRLRLPKVRMDLDTMLDYQRLLSSGVEIDMDAYECVARLSKEFS